MKTIRYETGEVIPEAFVGNDTNPARTCGGHRFSTKKNKTGRGLAGTDYANRAKTRPGVRVIRGFGLETEE
jgi:hypothetical protein